MSMLKIWWHVKTHAGHVMASFTTTLGLRKYYCQTCRCGLKDF
jgi:hypothetical protein